MNPDCPATNPACQHTRRVDAISHGCTCPEAKADHARAQKFYKHRIATTGQRLLVDATGTRRRLQALMAIGWRNRDLGARLGITGEGVDRTCNNRRLVHVRTAARIAALYDELWDKPGPSDETRRRAAAKGWPPPLWWDDDLIDDPTATSDYTPYRKASRTDRRAKAARTVADLSAKGLSAREIGEHLGISRRHVERFRAEIRAKQASALADPRDSLGDMQVAS